MKVYILSELFEGEDHVIDVYTHTSSALAARDLNDRIYPESQFAVRMFEVIK